MSSNNNIFDPLFSEGAHNAINTCLRLQPKERITIISDEAAKEIAAALISEVKKVGSQLHAFVLESFDQRPLSDMPLEILEDLQKSQVSIYAASAEQGELRIRMQMMEVVNKNKIRHAHMVNITKEIMLQGMRADYLQIDQLSQKILDKAQNTEVINVKSSAGTDIEANFSPNLKWIKTSGIISHDKWGNLPGGEIFTSPFNVHGRFVVDGVVGNYLCQKYGDLAGTPLFIEIENSRIKKIESDNKDLVREFSDYIHTDENSNRVGEFAIGTNLAVKQIIGNILQDEKMPGIHIAFGHPYSEHTGQDWTSTTHIDCVGRDFDIWMDDEMIMKEGKFLLPIPSV